MIYFPKKKIRNTHIYFSKKNKKNNSSFNTNFPIPTSPISPKIHLAFPNTNSQKIPAPSI